jgi:hypothetical protein
MKLNINHLRGLGYSLGIWVLMTASHPIWYQV